MPQEEKGQNQGDRSPEPISVKSLALPPVCIYEVRNGRWKYLR
jgi:hypothetical protein